jgi:hypothetical protein
MPIDLDQGAVSYSAAPTMAEDITMVDPAPLDELDDLVHGQDPSTGGCVTLARHHNQHGPQHSVGHYIPFVQLIEPTPQTGGMSPMIYWMALQVPDSNRRGIDTFGSGEHPIDTDSSGDVDDQSTFAHAVTSNQEPHGTHGSRHAQVTSAFAQPADHPINARWSDDAQTPSASRTAVLNHQQAHETHELPHSHVTSAFAQPANPSSNAYSPGNIQQPSAFRPAVTSRNQGLYATHDLPHSQVTSAFAQPVAHSSDALLSGDVRNSSASGYTYTNRYQGSDETNGLRQAQMTNAFAEQVNLPSDAFLSSNVHNPSTFNPTITHRDQEPYQTRESRQVRATSAFAQTASNPPDASNIGDDSGNDDIASPDALSVTDTVPRVMINGPSTQGTPNPEGLTPALPAEQDPNEKKWPCLHAPYGCTARSKGLPEWRRHYRDVHMHIWKWRCSIGDCDQVFLRADHFRTHLGIERQSSGHLFPNNTTEEKDSISAIVKACKYPGDRPVFMGACPFCRITFVGLEGVFGEGVFNQRLRHIGRHISQMTELGRPPIDPSEWNFDPMHVRWLVEKGKIDAHWLHWRENEPIRLNHSI